MKVLKNTLTSNEVAEMVGRSHDNVLKDVRTILRHLGLVKNDDSSILGEEKNYLTPNLAEAKIGFDDFFIESTYKNSQNKELPNYLLSKKGCELYSTRMTGEKGTRFAVAYIERFNEMENHIKQQLPTTFAEALRLAADLEEDKLLLEQKVAEYEPKINYLDMILGSTDTVTISQIAADYGMSAYQMNKSLNKLGVQHKVGGQWILYKKHMRQGYVKSHTTEIPKSGGGTKTVMNTKWTQKGRLFIYELLKEDDIYPVMDLEETA